MSAGKPLTTLLFITHGVDGFDAHSTGSRGKTSENAHGAYHKSGKERCPETYLEVSSNDAILRITQFKHLENHDAKENATHTCHEGQHNALGDDLRQYHPRRSTNGTADTYLGGALTHGHHHDIRHTDGTCQQRSQTYEPDKEVNTLEEVVPRC